MARLSRGLRRWAPEVRAHGLAGLTDDDQNQPEGSVAYGNNTSRLENFTRPLSRKSSAHRAPPLLHDEKQYLPDSPSRSP
ncbi:hypothetical protein PCANC_01315 [Puccinia coronata f. sp. avenae]|uniref:Uncharacterized protein n=1 Tax=Puccinia coronata f. sp. avenae TaxID=200324 RepID=A0A2N5VLN8_9BASI|nr:hypothetical protein PCANC_22647 [Puccinia coronata f. sp. avenae]PLW50898.1 hypothetical protein PCASD_01207 [Puccinia coronata f. sp. avenae]PLW57701.1 hypothetical protein PCANC_01315 [Puccinia coronata f. sp. avenae]